MLHLNWNSPVYVFILQRGTCICMRWSYLVLVEVCNDNSYKQSESNHASQKHKHMDVDAMDLQEQRCINWARCEVTRLIQVENSRKRKEGKQRYSKIKIRFNTGPTRWIMTSRTSTQPLSESTSNKANIAFPTLSKLKFRGLALEKDRIDASGTCCRKTILKQGVIK